MARAVAPDDNLGLHLDGPDVRRIPGAVSLVAVGLLQVLLDARSVITVFGLHTGC